jgi:hypothetical protein
MLIQLIPHVSIRTARRVEIIAAVVVVCALRLSNRAAQFNPNVTAVMSGFLTFRGPGPTVQTSTWVRINGTMEIDTIPQSAFSVALGALEIQATMNNNTFTFASFVSPASTTVDVNHFTGLTIVSQAGSLSLQGTGRTPAFTVPTNEPVPMTFRLRAGFNHLPDGYTVDGLGIVDNRFVVPEPAALVLLMSAAVGWCLSRRRIA